MLTNSQVLPFLEHPERAVRNHAAARLKEPNCAPATALHALQAYDKFPEGELNPLRYLASVLPADPQCAREIARRATSTDDKWLRDHLENSLCDLPAATLEVVGAELENNAALSEEVRGHIAFQRAQLDHSAEHLWETLLDMARKTDAAWRENSRHAFSQISVNAVQKALARHADFITPKILEILNDKSIEDTREIYAAELAGMIKLDAAVPALVQKLKIDADLLRESVATALASIATPSAVEQLAAFIPSQEWHMRLFAIGSLIRIASPESEAAMLALLAGEESPDLRTNLAFGLCMLVSQAGFDQVRQMVDNNDYDPQQVDLEEALYATSVMLDRPLANADSLRERIEADYLREDERFRDPEFRTVIAELGKLMAMNPELGEDDEDDRFLLPQSEAIQPFVRAEPKVGRNDPCPCGSGKKYKKCCGAS